jgi:hypothetical protein
MLDLYNSFNQPVEDFNREVCERFSLRTIRAALQEGTRDGAMLQLAAGDHMASTKKQYERILDRAVSAHNEVNLLDNFSKSIEYVIEGHNSPLDRRPMAGWPIDEDGALFSPDELFAHSENAFKRLVYERAGSYGFVIAEHGYFRDSGGHIFGNRMVIGPTPAQKLCTWLDATSKNSGERRILI